MFAAIREVLGTSRLEGTGQGGGGCISDGEVFKTDTGKVFIKRNSKNKVRTLEKKVLVKRILKNRVNNFDFMNTLALNGISWLN